MSKVAVKVRDAENLTEGDAKIISDLESLGHSVLIIDSDAILLIEESPILYSDVLGNLSFNKNATWGSL